MTSLQPERPALLGDAGVEDDLEQQVAELAGELLVVLLVDGVGDLVGLLDRHRLDGLVGLLAVPRAAAGGAQAGDQLDEAGEELAGLGRRGGGLDPGHGGIFPSNGSAAYSVILRGVGPAPRIRRVADPSEPSDGLLGMTEDSMKLRLFQIDAFASQVFGGNPAAVVPLERWLDDHDAAVDRRREQPLRDGLLRRGEGLLPDPLDDAHRRGGPLRARDPGGRLGGLQRDREGPDRGPLPLAERAAAGERARRHAVPRLPVPPPGGQRTARPPPWPPPSARARARSSPRATTWRSSRPRTRCGP